MTRVKWHDWKINMEVLEKVSMEKKLVKEMKRGKIKFIGMS